MSPRVEKTQAGDQYVISETPPRQIPDAPLRAKRPQRDGLTELEIGSEEDRQEKLF
jgi:hypothetical protein